MTGLMDMLGYFKYHYNMNQQLQIDITQVLTNFLNREPTIDEVINAQTDIIIMGKVRDLQLDRLKLQLGINN